MVTSKFYVKLVCCNLSIHPWISRIPKGVWPRFAHLIALGDATNRRCLGLVACWEPCLRLVVMLGLTMWAFLLLISFIIYILFMYVYVICICWCSLGWVETTQRVNRIPWQRDLLPKRMVQVTHLVVVRGIGMDSNQNTPPRRSDKLLVIRWFTSSQKLDGGYGGLCNAASTAKHAVQQGHNISTGPHFFGFFFWGDEPPLTRYGSMASICGRVAHVACGHYVVWSVVSDVSPIAKL